MNKRHLRLSRFVPCLFTLLVSVALPVRLVFAETPAQTARAASGPVCTKCTAGPQSGTPMRTLIIRVIYNNKPVKNATVTLTDPSGATVNTTLTTGASGTVQTSAMLGMYKLSAQKNSYIGSTDLSVSSGTGVVQVVVPVTLAAH